VPERFMRKRLYYRRFKKEQSRNLPTGRQANNYGFYFPLQGEFLN